MATTMVPEICIQSNRLPATESQRVTGIELRGIPTSELPFATEDPFLVPTETLTARARSDYFSSTSGAGALNEQLYSALHSQNRTEANPTLQRRPRVLVVHDSAPSSSKSRVLEEEPEFTREKAILRSLSAKIKEALRLSEEAEGEDLPDHIFNTSLVSQATGLSKATLYRWVEGGIVGKRVRLEKNAPIHFGLEDLLIIQLIIEGGKQAPVQTKRAISLAIRTGLHPDEALDIALKTKVEQKVHARELSLQAREKLIDLKNAILEIELPEPITEPLSVRGAEAILCQHLPDPTLSRSTLQKLITISTLGEPSSIPSTIRVNESGHFHAAFDGLKDLAQTIGVAHQVLESKNLTVTTAFGQAQAKIRKERKNRMSLEDLVVLVLERAGKARPSQALTRRTVSLFLERLRGEPETRPPLPEQVNPQDVLIFGVQKRYQDEMANQWAELIKAEPEKAKLTRARQTANYRMTHWPSLTSVLKRLLEPGAKVPPRRLSDAVSWFTNQGVRITEVSRSKGGKQRYYRPSPEELAQIELLLEDDKVQEELRAVLEKTSNTPSLWPAEGNIEKTCNTQLPTPGLPTPGVY